MNANFALHLDKEERMKLGAFYTPKKLVSKVYDFIKPYINSRNNSIVFDSAGGCGAFFEGINDVNYRIADIDATACTYLKKQHKSEYVFNDNTLLNVDRKKYNISDDDFLIMIGNPPYNDMTSEFKSGKKGKSYTDLDLADRDLGISFLKSYDKYKADIVCVLHPLSYLIKKANFNRLNSFRMNYKLEKALIFSSAEFEGTGIGKFPVMIGFYKRNTKGMDYEYIKNFTFNVMNSHGLFRLNDFLTTDGFIKKYPEGKVKVNKITGLFFYTFRDFNTIKKNATFLPNYISNAIIVHVEDFYKYAYLFAMKRFFCFENDWIIGNLSPLIDIDFVEKNKKIFVKFALNFNPILMKIPSDLKNEITNYYNISVDMNIEENSIETENLISKFANKIKKMIFN